MTVINESCEKEQKKLEEKLEVLLMEQKMMKLTEKKAKEDLEELNNDLLELRKEDLEVNEKLLEQRADAESKREVYASQLRCLKDELVNTNKRMPLFIRDWRPFIYLRADLYISF